MTDIIQFAVLGLGAGAVYALVAQGVILIYRASGVLNFAQGAMAMSGGFVFYELTEKHGWPNWPAFIVTLLLLGVVGALVHQLLMRPLRRASPLARVIATLGVLTILDAAATIRYSASSFFVLSWLPTKSVHLPHSIIATEDRLYLVAIAVGLTVALYAVGRFTRVGLATTAVAENPRAAASLGWSPDRLGILNWTLGAMIAAAAGILIMPITSLSVTSLTWLVVPAMAAALVGGFTSFPLTLAGGLAIGILQSELTRYSSRPGAPDAVPFLLIILVLVVRGKSLPLRSHLLDRLPELGSGVFRWRGVLFGIAAVVAATFLFPADWVTALTVSMISAIIFLSVVVLTGYAGQLSLAQYALAGAGALFAARLVIDSSLPFELALVIGVLGAVVVGVVFAVPALRARGVNLAIVTLGLGLVFQHVVFNNESYAGGFSGLVVGNQTFLGIHLDATLHPRAYAFISLGFLVVCSWAVCNLRRSRAGRRLIAIRTNERAAASLGVSVFKAKIYAFAVSAGLAGLGGILLSFMSPAIYFTAFDPVSSITTVLLTVVGGVGYVTGPLFASTLANGGFPGGVIAQHVGSGAQWLTLLGGVIVLAILIQDPNGMARNNSLMLEKLRRRLTRSRKKTPAAETVQPVASAAPAAPQRQEKSSVLDMTDMTVRFGGVLALDNVSLNLPSGEVVGLIGPNGAGKTTLIDAVTGYVRLTNGVVTLDGCRIDKLAAHKRSRLGVVRSFQSLELFDDVSVLDNIRAACDPRDDKAFLTNLAYPGASPLSPVAEAAVGTFNLHDDLQRRPEELPYGRRRLVAIARAVATGPKFLLLDEPAAGLSELESREVSALVRMLAREWNLGVLLIEHDVSVVMSACDRVTVLDFGRNIAAGTPEQIRANPAVIAAYLGEEHSESASSSGAPVGTQS